MRKIGLILSFLSVLAYGCKKQTLENSAGLKTIVRHDKAAHQLGNLEEKIDSIFVNLNDSMVTTYYAGGKISKEKSSNVKDSVWIIKQPSKKQSNILLRDASSQAEDAYTVGAWAEFSGGINYHKVTGKAEVRIGYIMPDIWQPGYAWIKDVDWMTFEPVYGTISAGGLTYNTTITNKSTTHEGIGSPSVKLRWSGIVVCRETPLNAPLPADPTSQYPVTMSRIVYAAIPN